MRPVPVVFAATYLILAFRVEAVDGGIMVRARQGGAMERVLAVTALGIITLAAYNHLYVNLMEQGHWYFPISTLFVSLATVSWLGRLEWPKSRVGVLSAAAAGVILATVYFVMRHRQPGYHERYTRFYFEEAPLIRETYGDRPPRVLSVDDGIVAFSLGFPTMSGTGFTLDAEGCKHKRMGTLGDLAVTRGYDRLASLIYVNFSRFSAHAQSQAIRKWMQRHTRLFKDPGQYDFSVDYKSPTSGFVILRVESR